MTISLVSVSVDGGFSSGDSHGGNISGNGRYVAFSSFSSSLAAIDTNTQADVFLYDAENRSIELISVNSLGVPVGAANNSGGFHRPEVSNDGDLVVFTSRNGDLVETATAPTFNIYLRDTELRTTSVLSSGTVGSVNLAGGSEAAISGDGQHVVFSAAAQISMESGVLHNGTLIVRYNTQSKTHSLVTQVTNTTDDVNGASGAPDISDNGRYVVYISDSPAVHASAGLSTDGPELNEVFLHDTTTGTTRAISESSGVAIRPGVQQPKISADGSTVVYFSMGSHFGTNESVIGYHLVVYDVATGAVERIALGSSLPTTNTPAHVDISGDGRYVTFVSFAPPGIPNDGSGPNAYVYDRQTDQYARVTQAEVNARESSTYVGDIFISDDGSRIGYASGVNSILPGDDNDDHDVFLTTNPLFGATRQPTEVPGTDGNDRITVPDGPVTLDAGAGFDTAVLSLAASAVTVTAKSNGSFQIVSGGTASTFSNVERIQLTDGTIALDLTGNAGQTYRLYQAAFDRTPDDGGLSHNVNLMDGGLSIFDMAAAFIASQEFQNTYGPNISNTAFITLLYQNVLNRAPDDAGLAGWLDAMNGGQSHAQVLFGFSESTENKANVASAIDDGIWLV